MEIPEDYYGFIYKTTFPNGKIYIGQTVNRVEVKYFGSGNACVLAINKYGKANLKREILKFCLSKNELNKWEKAYIIKYNSTCSKIGYNIERGSYGQGYSAESTKAKLREISSNISDETRRKRSEALKGKKLSIEHCLKISESKKGKKLSPKHCINLSKSKKGEIHSKEHNEKVSKALKGRTFSKETLQRMKEGQQNRTIETRRKMSEANLGKKHSAEVRKKISRNNARYWTGKPRSEETKQKIRETFLRKKLS